MATLPVESIYQCRLLGDEPADTDAFGPHSQIAKAIQDLILSEEGGKAIALVGSWGSGKSTVVGFLRDGFLRMTQIPRTEPKTGVFIFDAWSHERDPLRRVFLERLIGYLRESGWISGEFAEGRLSELKGRLKKTRTTIIPVLNNWAIATALFLMLIPFAQAIQARYYAQPTSGFPWIPFSIYVGPALMILLAWLVARKAGVTDRRGVLGALINRTVQTTEAESIETPDPTSIEFQELFLSIAAEALKDKRGLVIVMDNLDRVNLSDALKLWAAMQTFLDVPTVSGHEWVKRLWVIVPFDPSGVERLWKAQDRETRASRMRLRR